MRRYPVKENHIGSVVSEIIRTPPPPPLIFACIKEFGLNINVHFIGEFLKNVNHKMISTLIVICRIAL